MKLPLKPCYSPPFKGFSAFPTLLLPCLAFSKCLFQGFLVAFAPLRMAYMELAQRAQRDAYLKSSTRGKTADLGKRAACH